MYTHRKLISLILAASMSIVGTACRENARDVWSEEAIKSGYLDPVVVKDDQQSVVIMASAGKCRVRIIIDKDTGTPYVAVPGDNENFSENPSLETLKEDPRFDSCFKGEEAQSSDAN